jgi:hypothetical protein
MCIKRKGKNSTQNVDKSKVGELFVKEPRRQEDTWFEK